VACRTVFAWAVGQRLLAHNPFKEVRITVPRKARKREDKAFSPEEAKVILSAALAIEPKTKAQAAKRWVPWLCAYSGARAGEITQLRGADVITEGIPAIKITPEAGTVKTGKPRTVPLHEHLLAQGFLEFVKASGKGPLFYNSNPKRLRTSGPAEATNPPKARSVKARERIAEWVRELGVTDQELQPNHAWRHTFMSIARRHGVTRENLYSITGHTAKDVGESYGTPTLVDKAEALKKFPRYETTVTPNSERVNEAGLNQ